MVLLASSSHDLFALERYAAECEAAGMKVSTSKSEAMSLDGKRVRCSLQVRSGSLLQAEELNYRFYSRLIVGWSKRWTDGFGLHQL